MHGLLAHAKHPVDLLDSKPVQNIGHQGLEAHVLDAGDIFGASEVVGSPVFSSLPGVVNDCHSLSVSAAPAFQDGLQRIEIMTKRDSGVNRREVVEEMVQR